MVLGTGHGKSSQEECGCGAAGPNRLDEEMRKISGSLGEILPGHGAGLGSEWGTGPGEIQVCVTVEASLDAI